MSTLLIWSDEIQKFADLLKENKKLPSTYDQFMVLGTELRISDYNKLRQLPIPDDKLSLSTALSEKRDTLLFILGMLKAKNESRVCTIASVPKELSDFAKEQDMELLSMAAAAKGSDKKIVKPRVRNLRKTEPVAEESNKHRILMTMKEQALPLSQLKMKALMNQKRPKKRSRGCLKIW